MYYKVSTHKESARRADILKIYGAFHNKKYFRLRVLFKIGDSYTHRSTSYKTLQSAIKKARNLIASPKFDVEYVMIADNQIGEVFWECCACDRGEE